MDTTLVVPVKELGRAKTRLGLPLDERREVMRWFVEHLLDVAGECSRVGTVVVVGSTELVPRHHEVVAVDDPRRPGLGGAVRAARAWARRWRPGVPIGVLPVDLPWLSAAELDDALARASASCRAFVPDHLGTGTTLVTAHSPRALVTAYGEESARRHRELGLVPLDAGPGLRHDVDTPADLRTLLVGAAVSA